MNTLHSNKENIANAKKATITQMIAFFTVKTHSHSMVAGGFEVTS